MWTLSVQRRFFHSSLSLMTKTPAEKRWLVRQLKDPYVKAYHILNFRCRSAFKLLEIDDKFHILQPGYNVVDCGAAPGAWSQIAVQRVNSDGAEQNSPRGTVVGVDLLHILPVDGAHFLSFHDITDPATGAKVQELLPCGQAHVILSDMAPNPSGLRDLDQERLVTMCLSLIDLADRVLKPRGSLLCKHWDGRHANHLQEKLSSVFGSVRIIKPIASTEDLAERYFLAQKYRKRVQ